ncbi:hypothetical protein Fleli_2897 [Bernardetia litoralis DSM 6794]|uniref:DUF937 domain-containing protein n=1 Tax=Bernardetia litoralis (strain ATCC 23117 / DSM 6794 / NBRC 15988 / NCIMB 1366 / Fx l1 / Sio-4) TaxID=880071 RepID=I4AMR2_BERLS|nr:hypothetical protein [Bernardetia litoralis]AFM05247.1 hypothetical protein Fleli_2897 [Bernardetia litoralis DSM 6794]
MLDDLLKLAQSQLAPQLKEEAHLSEAQIAETADVAKGSFLTQMASEAVSGNLPQLLDIFNGKATATTANPLIMRLVNQFGGDMMEKMGISSETAAMVSNMVIPFVMSKIASPETGSAEDEGSMMSKLGLDNLDGIGGMLGGLLGGKGGIGGLFS